MKVNYVLMYGIPYLRYREFDTFENCSKFLVNKGIVNYSIFKKLEDDEEVEMIYRDNDIRYLENLVKDYDSKLQQKENIIKEVREYIENNDLYEQDYDYDYEENLVVGPPSDETARKILLGILDKEVIKSENR